MSHAPPIPGAARTAKRGGPSGTNLNSKPLTTEAAQFLQKSMADREQEKTARDRYEKWRKVQLYKKHFGNSLNYNKKLSEESSEEALDLELLSLTDQLSVPSSTTACKEGILFCFEQFENLCKVWNPAELRTENLTAIARKLIEDKKIMQNEIPEIAVVYNRWFCQGPLVRAAIQAMYVVKTVDQMNRGGFLKTPLNQPVDKTKINQEDEDL